MKKNFTPLVIAICSLLTSTAYAQVSNTAYASVEIDNDASSHNYLVGTMQTPASCGLQGDIGGKQIVLNWTVDETELINRFEVERSFDGVTFMTAGLVFGAERKGKEDFLYYEKVKECGSIFYRLKMYDKEQAVNYSRILTFEASANKNNDMKILNNPVTDKLSFRFQSADNFPVLVKIVDMNGRVQLSKTLSSHEGSNLIIVPNTSLFDPGTYVIELSKANERRVAKFVKQ